MQLLLAQICSEPPESVTVGAGWASHLLRPEEKASRCGLLRRNGVVAYASDDRDDQNNYGDYYSTCFSSALIFHVSPSLFCVVLKIKVFASLKFLPADRLRHRAEVAARMVLGIKILSTEINDCFSAPFFRVHSGSSQLFSRY